MKRVEESLRWLKGGYDPFSTFSPNFRPLKLFLHKFEYSSCINQITRAMYKFNFEKLEVWIKSRLLTKKIYLDSRSFPEEEKFGISSQLRRAVVSVCSNIAEGASRKSKKEQVHFYGIAFSSLMETMNQIIICNDLGYLSSDLLDDLRQDVHVISLMLNNLAKSASRTS